MATGRPCYSGDGTMNVMDNKTCPPLTHLHQLHVANKTVLSGFTIDCAVLQFPFVNIKQAILWIQWQALNNDTEIDDNLLWLKNLIKWKDTWGYLRLSIWKHFSKPFNSAWMLKDWWSIKSHWCGDRRSFESNQNTLWYDDLTAKCGRSCLLLKISPKYLDDKNLCSSSWE